MLVVHIDVVPLRNVILFPFLQKTGRGLACRSKAKEEALLTVHCAFCCLQSPWVMSMNPAPI